MITHEKDVAVRRPVAEQGYRYGTIGYKKTYSTMSPAKSHTAAEPCPNFKMLLFNKQNISAVISDLRKFRCTL